MTNDYPWQRKAEAASVDKLGRTYGHLQCLMY